MNLLGKQLIGVSVSAEGESTFQAFNPTTGEKLPTKFHKATKEELETAAQKAQAAFKIYRKKSGLEKAAFLEKIAEEETEELNKLLTTWDMDVLESPYRLVLAVSNDTSSCIEIMLVHLQKAQS